MRNSPIDTVVHNAQQRPSIIDQTNVRGDGTLTLQQATESDRLQHDIKSWSAILSPVRRRPSEVLGLMMSALMSLSVHCVFTYVFKVWLQTALAAGNGFIVKPSVVDIFYYPT